MGDITCIRTWEGFACLATVACCCTKKLVGYAMADHMRTSLVCDAIDMAVRNCPHKEGETIFHSDRGCQYTSETFAQHLKSYGIVASVGMTGVCWGNAWAESVGATLKKERVYQMVYPARVKAIRDVASWIELEHTITNDSTHPWDTASLTRSRRSTAAQDKQPETRLSPLSTKHQAVHRSSRMHCSTHSSPHARSTTTRPTPLAPDPVPLLALQAPAQTSSTSS